MDKKGYKVILIRHAESIFNQAQYEANGPDALIKVEAENNQVKFREDLFDCNITKDGYNQCKKAHDAVKDLPITHVICSPLLRALETCYEIFKDHKNKPKIIVHPLFREMILSVCDIGSNLPENIERYSKFGFDFSLMEKYKDNYRLWTLWQLRNQKHAEEINDKIRASCKSEQDYLENSHKLLNQYMKSIWPNNIETQIDSNNRTTDQKKEIIEMYKRIKEGLICIVGHSRTMQAFTSKGYKEDGGVIDARWLDNCEVYETTIYEEYKYFNN